MHQALAVNLILITSPSFLIEISKYNFIYLISKWWEEHKHSKILQYLNAIWPFQTAWQTAFQFEIVMHSIFWLVRYERRLRSWKKAWFAFFHLVCCFKSSCQGMKGDLNLNFILWLSKYCYRFSIISTIAIAIWHRCSVQ